MGEYAFELALCARLEAARGGVVARQLGAGVEAPGNRVLDVVHVAPGPGFDARTRLTDRAIPPEAVAADVGPGRARYWKEAFDCHPQRARRAVERAVEAGFFERERRNGREYVRQAARYPEDWAGEMTGIENKPDLGSPGDLRTQLRKDVSLGLLDRVVLATESHVTGAHRNRLPDPVGIWRIHRDDRGLVDDLEVIREPVPLDDDGGIEVLAERPGRTEVAVVGGSALAAARRRVAERAYGKGWRTYELPACAEPDPAGAGLPYCSHEQQVVEPGECGPACPGRDGRPPDVDLDAVRERRSGWVRNPDGGASRQAGLDRFG